MLDLLRRLALPFILLVALVGTSIALDRVGNEPLEQPDPVDEAVTTAPDTPVYSFRRAPELLSPRSANDELIAELQAWVDALPPKSCFVATSGGETIFEHQPDTALTPASNMKILTAIAALETLGPDHTFKTRISALARPNSDGVIEGDLYVIGGGDPVLMTDVYAALQPRTDSQVRSSVDDLADQTVAVNISQITGAVRVDDDRFDDDRSVGTWPARFLTEGQVGVLGAAVIDDGFVGLTEAYASQIVPRDVEPPPLPRADDPAVQFGANLDFLLRERGVTIFGAPGRSDDTPRGLVDLVIWESPPLSEIVAQMLVNSDNTTAEMLIKAIGVAESDQGSTTAGTLAMSALLRSSGVVEEGLFVVDGSGLSDGNTVTCRQLTTALDLPAHRSTLRDSMPVGGESGTLARSFREGPGKGRIRAKTGFLATASALSGYFTTDRDVEVTFSLIINTAEQREITPEDIIRWQRPLPRILAPYPAGPDVADLAPIGSALATS